MFSSQLTLSHARDLVSRITKDDDGAHAAELLELIHGIADPDNEVGLQVQKDLYCLTEDFDVHFREDVSKLGRTSLSVAS